MRIYVQLFVAIITLQRAGGPGLRPEPGLAALLHGGGGLQVVLVPAVLRGGPGRHSTHQPHHAAPPVLPGRQGTVCCQSPVKAALSYFFSLKLVSI